MDTKLLARIGAIVFVAIAITMTAITMLRLSQRAPEPAVTPAAPTDADPLSAELVRCQSIGGAGASDGACLRAWAENRRRFLAPGSRPEARLPERVDASAPVTQTEVPTQSGSIAPASGGKR